MRREMKQWLGVVLLAGMAGVASANLLQNYSFETGTGQGGSTVGATVDNWTGWGTGWWASDSGAVYDGTYAIKRWDTGTGMYQDFAATVGTAYNFSLFCYDGSTEPLVDRYVELKAEWLNASFATVGSTVIGQFTPGTLNTWTEIAGQSTAVAGTVYGRIVITTAGGASAGGSAYYDMASVTAVPEPTALALLGIGLASVAVIRRKRR